MNRKLHCTRGGWSEFSTAEPFEVQQPIEPWTHAFWQARCDRPGTDLSDGLLTECEVLAVFCQVRQNQTVRPDKP